MGNSTNKFSWKKCIILFVLVLIFAISALCLVLFLRNNYSSYTGYDGYIWNGKKRSNKLSNEKVADSDAFEHTLIVAEDMSKYFSGDYVNISSSYVALLPYYQKNSSTVIFSEMKIKSITVFAKNDGNLCVNIAKVSDVVESRAKGGDLTVKNIKNYTVEAGKTTITFEEPILIGENETIVLGGNNSVPIYFAKDIPVNDEAGNFTLIDGNAHQALLQSSGKKKYSDTLAIEVKVLTDDDLPIFENMREDIQNAIGDLSTIKDYVGSEYWGVYIYGKENLFAGKTITKISIPIRGLRVVEGRTYLDLYLIDAFDNPENPDAIADRNHVGDTIGAQNYLNAHRVSTPLEVPAKDLAELQSRISENGYIWVDFDCNIEVGENQTLAFGGDAHGVEWAYLSNPTCDVVNFNQKQYMSQYRFLGKVGSDINAYGGWVDNNCAFFDVYYSVTHTIDTQLEKINSVEDKATKIVKLREILSGKYMSILGDSISTYEDYSNEYETQNSDIRQNGKWTEEYLDHNSIGNKMFYFNDVTGIHDNDNNEKTNFSETLGVPTVHDTWWMSTIDRLDMKLCVNNSSAGALVIDNLTTRRTGQLHDNTKYSDFQNDRNLGQDTDIYPDIVAIYMGINDFCADGDIEVEEFAYKYREMVLNVLKNYAAHTDDLRVFVFTIYPTNAGNSKWCKGEDHTYISEAQYQENLEKFNNKIRQIANEIEGVELVDLYKYFDSTRNGMDNYYLGDGLHPKGTGMKMMSDCLIDALCKVYVENKK